MTFDAVGAAWFALETSLRALAAALLVALVLRLLRVRAAVVLHSVWSAVLFAMLLMPVLPSIVPELPVSVPAAAGDLFDVAFGTNEAHPAVEAPARDRISEDLWVQLPARQGADRLTAVDNATPPSRPWLPRVLLIVYLAGVLLFGVRLSYGWLLASAMARRAVRRGPVRTDAGRHVYESPEVAVPMTVGVMTSLIILPTGWRAWTAETLAAIIAHEVAHVRRHDASIAFAAHLNRAVFWFHPLAWWLERKLAVTAEYVCDDVAARAIAAPGRYAEILVEMADIVRRNRGRLTWQAVGVNGAGFLNGRIARLLNGDTFASASRTKTVAAWIGCVLVIATVVACRQQTFAALREDPELAKWIASQDEQRRQFEADRDMTQEQADELEQRIAGNQEDFDSRRRLVTYYRANSKVAWARKVSGVRRQALWLIEHHPDHDVQAPAMSPQFDPEGFAAAKTLWERHLARPDVSPFVIFRAASFFAQHDKPYAEQLIVRGMSIDPDSAALKARLSAGVAGYQWPAQLASLYGAAIRGSESAWGTYNDTRTHVDRVNSPYAIEVRRKLEATADATLLARVGTILTRPNSSMADPAVKAAVEQARALGIRYLARALELDPQLESARTALVRIRLPGRATEADRLANRALEGYMVAEDITEYAKKDVVAGKQQRDEAKARADQVLKLAAAHAPTSANSAAVMTAHHILATAALRDGDRDRAVHHMRESVKVPVSEQLQYAPPFSWMRPVNRLLKAGEHEAVVEFLEAFARLTISDRDRLLRDAQAIREGQMPKAYQDTIARERK